MWLVKLALQNLVLPFLVTSQPNVDGFCFNMGHFKAIPRTVGPYQDRSFAPQRPQDQSSKNPRTLDRPYTMNDQVSFNAPRKKE